METNFVSWKDYEGMDAFAGAGNDVADLHKALNVGSDRDAPVSANAGDGFALRVENLDSTLRVTTFKMKHIRLWKQITKKAAWNTVNEFNQLQSYGDDIDDAWIGEGELPNESDSIYERKYDFTKYMGTVGVVSHQATLIKPANAPVLVQETTNRTMKLLRNTERALFKADSSLSALQYDGYEKLILDNAPAGNIIDLRGRPFSEDVLNDGAMTVHDSPNFGTPTDLNSMITGIYAC